MGIGEHVMGKKGSRTKRRTPYVPSPVYLGHGLKPEVSLCLDFCLEAIEAGWDIWPEHPKRRFDMVLVAREGCTTLMPDGTPVPPGTQVGVHAKTTLNRALVMQLKREAHRACKWGIGPHYIVGLVPCLPSTERQTQLADLLLGISAHGPVGLMYMYEQFNGHEHEETKRSQNLKNISRFGGRISVSRRFGPPLVPTFWTAPGSAGAKVVSAPKVRALRFVASIQGKGPMEYTALRKELHRHRAGSFDTWMAREWFVACGKRVDPKTGRSRTLYILNPNSSSRPDIRHADIYAAMRQHEQQEQAQGREHGAGA
jgi:hypothetical protein